MLRWGYVNTHGRLVIPAEYEDGWWFSEGLAAVKQDGKWGYIDQSVHVVNPFVFERASPFASGQAIVCHGTCSGCIKREGIFVFPPTFSAMLHFRESLVAVCDSQGRWGFGDRQGMCVIQPRFRGAGRFSEGLAPFSGTGQEPRQSLGYPNRDGETVIAS